MKSIMSTDWNDCYAKKETPWEKGQATPVLEEMWAKQQPLFTGRVFVPGCGIGHDARWLADRGLTVTGGDIAPLALEAARDWDRQSTASFKMVDVLSPPADLLGYFDGVWEHTCLCALAPELRNAYIKGLHTVLKSGGRVAGVFFINPEMDEGEEGPPFGISVEELKTLWESHGFTVHEHWVPTTGYEGRVGRELAMILSKN